MYDLEFLIETFKKHDKIAKKFRKESIEDFKETYPNDTLPGHLKEDFSLPEALVAICQEIQNLKHFIDCQ